MRTALFLSSAALICLSACGDSFSYDGNSYFPEDWASTYVKKTDCKESATHSGDYVIVHTSPDASDAYSDRAGAMPVGAVILKEQFADSGCSDFTAITAMKKLEDGASATHGDYDWQRVEADGSIALEGAQSTCSGCHSSSPCSDFLCEPQP